MRCDVSVLMQTSKVAPDIVVMERHTGRLVTGSHAPTAANLVAWITKHPTFEVLRPGQRTGHLSSSKAHSKMQSRLLQGGLPIHISGCGRLVRLYITPSPLLSTVDDKGRKLSSSNEETVKKPSGLEPSAIRSNVRKSLIEALQDRYVRIALPHPPPLPRPYRTPISASPLPLSLPLPHYLPKFTVLFSHLCHFISKIVSQIIMVGKSELDSVMFVFPMLCSGLSLSGYYSSIIHSSSAALECRHLDFPQVERSSRCKNREG